MDDDVGAVGPALHTGRPWRTRKDTAALSLCTAMRCLTHFKDFLNANYNKNECDPDSELLRGHL